MLNNKIKSEAVDEEFFVCEILTANDAYDEKYTDKIVKEIVSLNTPISTCPNLKAIPSTQINNDGTFSIWFSDVKKAYDILNPGYQVESDYKNEIEDIYNYMKAEDIKFLYIEA